MYDLRSFQHISEVHACLVTLSRTKKKWCACFDKHSNIPFVAGSTHWAPREGHGNYLFYIQIIVWPDPETAVRHNFNSSPFRGLIQTNKRKELSISSNWFGRWLNVIITHTAGGSNCQKERLTLRSVTPLPRFLSMTSSMKAKLQDGRNPLWEPTVTDQNYKF